MWPRGLTTAERNRLLLKLVSLTIIVSSWACQKSRSWACKCFQTLTDRASPGASMLEHAREQRIRSDQLQRSDFPIVKQRFVAQAMSILRWSRQSLQLTGVPGGLNATSNQVFCKLHRSKAAKATTMDGTSLPAGQGHVGRLISNGLAFDWTCKCDCCKLSSRSTHPNRACSNKMHTSPFPGAGKNQKSYLQVQ